MKKLMIPLTAVALLGGTAYAVDHVQIDQKDASHVAVAQKADVSNDVTEVTLHADANDSSKVLAKVDVSQRLVPFFNKGEWIKVGDPANGQVGWINKEQYRKAMNDAIQQSVQTVYVEQTDAKGKKPQITVYQNGKKLTGEQADAVYKKVQKRQKKMQKRFARFQQRMNQWANSQMQRMNGPMMNTPIMQPIVIVENNPGQPAKLAPPAPAKPKPGPKH